ncbi:hypothetical protein [Gimesia algae]|uniref:Uncharacterized protein n=1 Tax=Gimesia algae TaxID=2527971 RepID=A0A517VLC7_9PLAN|nr:hypothetical protein [Gimesia algae]QDT93807.1 hypothetical protein Pan161_54930 [Gimesia algae]
MRFLLIFSGLLAVVPFVIGFVVSLFITDGPWIARLVGASIPAFCTFFAAVLLGSRDFARHSATIKKVRGNLLASWDSTDEQFLSARPCEDTSLLLELREAIAQFFDVPACKVARDVDLISDLHVDQLEPSFQFAVVRPAIASRQKEPQSFGFSTTSLHTLDELVTAIREVLDRGDEMIQSW